MSYLRQTVFIALVCIASASPAAAQAWGRGWFEQLSGPEFRTWEHKYPIACVWDSAGLRWFFQTPERTTQDHRLVCLDVGLSYGSNKDREENGLIGVRLLEGNILLPFERVLTNRHFFEAQVGLGAIRFQGDDFEEWRFTLSPRVVIKPLKLISPRSARLDASNVNQRRDWRDILQFPIGAIWIAPDITNTDLRVTTSEPFKHGWLKRADYFLIDVSQFVGLR